MADLLTHVTSTWLLGKAALKKGRLVALLLLGALIPDIFNKAFYPLNSLFPTDFVQSLSVSHSLLGAAMISAVLALLFKDFFASFKVMTSGAFFHIFIDTLYTGGETVLWPLSWKSYSFGLFWSEDLTLFFIFNGIALAYLAYLGVKHWRSK